MSAPMARLDASSCSVCSAAEPTFREAASDSSLTLAASSPRLADRAVHLARETRHGTGLGDHQLDHLLQLAFQIIGQDEEVVPSLFLLFRAARGIARVQLRLPFDAHRNCRLHGGKRAQQLAGLAAARRADLVVELAAGDGLRGVDGTPERGDQQMGQQQGDQHRGNDRRRHGIEHDLLALGDQLLGLQIELEAVGGDVLHKIAELALNLRRNAPQLVHRVGAAG